MTGLAECHKVIPVMRPALAERGDMVYLVCNRDEADFLAHLAQRMLCNIPVPNPPPVGAVALSGIGVALIFVVLGVDNPLMRGAVLSVSKKCTARIPAGTFRHVGQGAHLFRAKRKALTVMHPRKLVIYYRCYNYSTILGV
jgi:hypothetical protein